MDRGLPKGPGARAGRALAVNEYYDEKELPPFCQTKHPVFAANHNLTLVIAASQRRSFPSVSLQDENYQFKRRILDRVKGLEGVYHSFPETKKLADAGLGRESLEKNTRPRRGRV